LTFLPEERWSRYDSRITGYFSFTVNPITASAPFIGPACLGWIFTVIHAFF
jgi:hypothetical protein